MANIFRLVKLARTAYKVVPVVIPIGLAVAKYAQSRLSKDVARSDASTPALNREQQDDRTDKRS
ncbi:hypothetical protein [Paracoccus benzoatiresistens]|uniref:Uncharacterized protein n=1 Tax=Paracoccus benzoatiresistens TaxID=2997341 RepID=A0ABT4J5H5_9RHOB|nr:hypothetical protein [Paracoccus sp. EF6]MCZ0962338.1 hypothetical protein [Paracoccus sp. EF6]